MNRPTITILAALLACGVEAAPMAGYLMGYFTESPGGDDNSWSLHLAVSRDGLEWMPLNQNLAVQDSMISQHGIRDPHFVRLREGGFVVLATDQRNTEDSHPTIHLWDTADFVVFDNERTAKLHDTGMHTFAPEAFWDPDKGRYAVIWAGDTDRNRIFVNYTSDFVEFGPHELFFDPGRDCADATLAGASGDGTHHLFLADPEAGGLMEARSGTLKPGSFSSVEGAGVGAGRALRAPTAFPSIAGDEWFLWAQSREGRFHAWTSGDLAGGDWVELERARFSHPPNAMHATVIRITGPEMEQLVEVWGEPTWRRLRCHTDPGLLLRHKDFRGMVSPGPFDPYEDAMWLVGPGLADRKGVSLESVNFPGRFLRERRGVLVVEGDDGSPEFAASATFRQVPGLADERASSFLLPGDPARYILHRKGIARVAEVKTAGDRERATFQLVY